MTDPPHVVAIAGSLRDDSTTRLALERALSAAESAGATTRLVDLREYDLPVFDADDREVGDADRLKTAVERADGVLLGTPVYHGSYSGALKNALDYLSKDEFEATTVGLLASAGGSFPRPTLEHLRTISRTLGAWTLPHQVAIPDAGSRFEDGVLIDEDLAERVDTLGTDVVRYAGVATYRDRRAQTPVPTSDD